MSYCNHISRLLSKFGILASVLFITTNAFAINSSDDAAAIEPDHSSADYNVGDVSVAAPVKAAPVAIVPPSKHKHRKETKIHHDKRVYYARSVTSNNPEYKTRFSILHETPSPKRIGGERLYNISDEMFRIEVEGKKIRLMDSPVFKLTGINSAKGRYGELQLHEDGTLHIHGASKRFRGKWDVDGTGARIEKVTPTHLVSGDLPATLRTFNKDGSERTNEDYVITFKAMAMGPYNGYWTDGTDIGIWLWGMSKKKTQSGEFTYVGMDLGIITVPTEVTSTVQPQEEAPVSALAPITPVGAIATGSNSTGTVPTAIGGGNNFGNNFVGGGFGVIPFGIGGGGGGNASANANANANADATVIVKTFCQEFPNDPSCRPLCERFPNDPSCKPLCERFPNDPTCKPRCESFPNDPSCRPLCEREPNNPSCKPLCERKPNHPKCDPVELCKKKPNHPSCRPLCERKPNHPSCKEDCDKYPNKPECKPLCERLPDHPSCNECPDGSVRDMMTGQCGTDDCTNNPNKPECKPICERDPSDPSCNPDTPVSAPWGLGTILVAFAATLFRRRRQ